MTQEDELVKRYKQTAQQTLSSFDLMSGFIRRMLVQRIDNGYDLEATITRLNADLAIEKKEKQFYQEGHIRVLATAEKLSADLASALEALKRIAGVVSYPVASEINQRGWDSRTIDASGSELITEIAAAELAKHKPQETKQ